MILTDRMKAGMSDTSQSLGLTGRAGLDVFLDQRPRRLDGIEIGRVGRQEPHGSAPRLARVLAGTLSDNNWPVAVRWLCGPKAAVC